LSFISININKSTSKVKVGTPIQIVLQNPFWCVTVSKRSSYSSLHRTTQCSSWMP